MQFTKDESLPDFLLWSAWDLFIFLFWHSCIRRHVYRSTCHRKNCHSPDSRIGRHREQPCSPFGSDILLAVAVTKKNTFNLRKNKPKSTTIMQWNWMLYLFDRILIRANFFFTAAHVTAKIAFHPTAALDGTGNSLAALLAATSSFRFLCCVHRFNCVPQIVN